MRSLRFLSLMIGALAALALGSLGASPVEAAPSPCHAAMSGEADPAPPKASKVMGCCIACTAAPLPQRPLGVASAPPVPTYASPIDLMPHGRAFAPDHGPPRA